jgi:hypothetical protein
MQNATLFYQNLRLHELLAVVIARNHSSAAFLSESTFKELEAISERSFSYLFLNWQQDTELMKSLEVHQAPALLFFKTGKEVSRLYEIPHLHDLALLIEQFYQD